MSKALLIIDLQNDFLENGALAVPKSNEIIPIINEVARAFNLVLASFDWHPKNHISFASTWGKKPGEVHNGQILWPNHCIQNSTGAQFPETFNRNVVDRVFYKGFKENVDSYSIFIDQNRMPASESYSFLQAKGIEELYIAGLATDYCVLASVLDALLLGYKVTVISDACRAVNVQDHDESKAISKMKDRGALFISSDEVLKTHLL